MLTLLSFRHSVFQIWSLIFISLAQTAWAVGPIVETDGFEGFAVGALEGQQGWVSVPNFGGGAIVESSVVQAGSKALEVQKAANVDRRLARPVSGFPTQRFIVIDWDMRLTPTGAPSGTFGPFFGVEAFDARPQIAVIGAFGVDATTGDVLYQSSPSGAFVETQTVAAFNAWNSFRMVLDFTTHNYAVFFNDAKLATSGFVDHNLSNPLTELTDADIAALAAGGDPASMAQTGTAYFDSFKVWDGIPGDFNINGVVNGADLDVWKTSFAVNSSGDADGNLDSDGNDFLIWQRQVGLNLLPALAVATAVPEPAAAALAAIALLAIVKRPLIGNR